MTSYQEKIVLDHLAKAFNEFAKMDRESPSHPDDLLEFKTGIHMAQAVIAHRLACRVDPKTWRGS